MIDGSFLSGLIQSKIDEKETRYKKQNLTEKKYVERTSSSLKKKTKYRLCRGNLFAIINSYWERHG